MEAIMYHIKTFGVVSASLAPITGLIGVLIYFVIREKLKADFRLISDCDNHDQMMQRDFIRKEKVYEDFITNKEYVHIQEKTNLYLETMAREFKEFKEDTRKDFDIIKVKVDNLLSRK